MNSNEEKICILLGGIIAILIAVGFIWGIQGGCWDIPTAICDSTNPRIGDYRVYSDEQYNIWNLEAPFGKYWVGENGKAYWTILAGHGSINSGYNESYVIKYLVNDELKTLIVESTDKDVHLIFISKDEKSYVRIQKYGYAYCNCDGTVDFGSSLIKSIIWIYIPEPEVNSDE